MGIVDIDNLWDYANPAASEARFRKLLPVARDSERTYLIQLLTQIARAQGLQDRFAEAHATLTEAESLLGPDDSLPRIRCLLERGRVFNSAGEPQKAAPLFVSAWELARKTGEDFYAIDAAHMLGICRPPQEATQWNQRALEAAGQSAQPRARNWRASILNNMGWTLHDTGDYPGALDCFQQALVCRQERNQAAETRIAKWCIARTLRSLNRVREALAMQEALLAEHQAAGTSDPEVLSELAECRKLLERTAG